jgi:hypothetical protein
MSEPIVATGVLVAIVVGFALGLLVASAVRRRRSRVTVPVRLGDALVVEADEAGPQDPWIEFQREMKRSRRTGRPLAILRLTGPSDDRALLDVATTLAELVRDVDRVWVEQRELFVLLPETDPAEAAVLAERLDRRAARVLQGMALAMACFPTDALTSDDLLARLRGAPPVATRPTPGVRGADGPAIRPRALAGVASVRPAAVARNGTATDDDRGANGGVAS